MSLETTPRWFLALLALGCVTGGAVWLKHVEDHIQSSSEGYQRIAVLEARVEALQGRVVWCERWHRLASREQKAKD